jgi:hypothetical protein
MDTREHLTAAKGRQCKARAEAVYETDECIEYSVDRNLCLCRNDEVVYETDECIEYSVDRNLYLCGNDMENSRS